MESERIVRDSNGESNFKSNVMQGSTEKEKLRQSINVVDSLIEMRKDIFDEKHTVCQSWRDQLNVVTETSEYLKTILENAPNQAIQEWRVLAARVQQLNDKLDGFYDEMSSMINDVTLVNNVICPTSMFVDMVKDILRHPVQQALRNFTTIYKVHSPLTIVYNLVSFLVEVSTNPIAMENEKEKSDATLHKWQDIIGCIFGTFMFLEAFSRGLLGIKSKYNLEQIMKTASNVRVFNNQWKKEEDISKEDKCWEEIKTFTNNYIPNSGELTNSQKADEIMRKIDSYSTDDSYYVCVFNEAVINKDFTYHCPNDSSQMTHVWNTGKSNVVIYRSRNAKTMEKAEFDKAKKDVTAMRVGKLQYTGTFENIIQQQLLDKGYFRNDGFVCLVDHRCNPQIRYTAIEKGPGWWERVVIASSDRKQLTQNALIVGLP